jgi:transcription termination factor Rho
MPVKKSTRSSKPKASSENAEEPTVDSKKESKKAAVDSPIVPIKQPESDAPDRQLLFSTDGSESEEERPRPEEENEVKSSEEKSPDQLIPAKQEKADGGGEGNPVPPKGNPNPPGQGRGKHNHPNHPRQPGHPNSALGQKKLTWQEKKKLRKKPKFKKPQRLPYEETEAKPLQVGQLLDSETLKTDEEIAKILQPLLESGKDCLNLDEHISLNLKELTEKISKLSIDEDLPAAPLREELIDALLAFCLKSETPVSLSGIVQIMEDGHGFILQENENYRLKSQSAFIPALLVRSYGLKTGHFVKSLIRAKMEESTCPIVLQVDEVMGVSPEEATRVTPFTELTPYYPLKRMYLETHHEVEWDNVAMRVVDLVSPVGFGQRGLIVAPPRTGKTILQQAIARALRQNNPEAHLIVLLVDERPEEVTDFRRQVPDAEVIASTFDESAESHVHAAEIVIEKARRMVEHNQHVVILLDSITRMARAYNATMPNSGKILSGGVEATALQRPKRFFGSARNIEGGGSLTILGTALVETGSKMDEVIFEEFKGTGNMELHLDRELSNKRIFPALDFEKSGTRKEELLYHKDELNKIYALRRSMKGVPPTEAMEMFIQRVKKTKNNPEFLMGLGR